MALMQLSDWVYGLKHLEITQKKNKQFYYEKPWFIFWKVVMSTCFLLKKL